MDREIRPVLNLPVTCGTYVAADELVLGKETKVRWLLIREVLAQGEEISEAISYNFQARQCTWRTRLKCRIVAAESRVKVVNRNGERCGTVTRAAQCDIRDSRFGHESHLGVPERLFFVFLLTISSV